MSTHAVHGCDKQVFESPLGHQSKTRSIAGVTTSAITVSGQHSLWYTLLRDEGILPVDSPPTIFAASGRGQLSIEEIVDGYDVAYRPVRDMFVDYLRERQPGLDYKTIRQLATKLILLFWKDLELHHPGIDSLHLSGAVARAWKERLRHVRYGNHKLGQQREDPYTILMAIRAFYADLSHWALEDPARWAPWAAPSPVDSRDLAGMTKSAKHRQSRMHQRIRELAPLLPASSTQRRRIAPPQRRSSTQPGRPHRASCSPLPGRRCVAPHWPPTRNSAAEDVPALSTPPTRTEQDRAETLSARTTERSGRGPASRFSATRARGSRRCWRSPTGPSSPTVCPPPAR